jgi:hypothetical protein
MKTKNLGQSTIEFLVTMVFSLGILLMFVRLGINTTAGFLAHYATYMASRTYLVVDQARNDNDGLNDGSDDPAEREAIKVFKDFRLERYGIINLDTTKDIVFNKSSEVGSPIKYEYVGPKFTHTMPLSLIPIFGPPIELTLLTESFIGREPTRGECYKRICRAMEESRGQALGCSGGAQILHVTLFDNGC